MKPRKILPIWLMSILVAIMITSLVTQATSEPEKVVEVVYVEVEPEIPEVIEEPVAEVLEPQMVSVGEYELTAYCSCEICCGEYADGYTFTGEKATEGITVAADPDSIPLGTSIYIEGVGERVVQDIGGSILGKRIDVYFGGEDAHQRALEFGRQEREVFIYE